jgi:hypothetical protein
MSKRYLISNRLSRKDERYVPTPQNTAKKKDLSNFSMAIFLFFACLLNKGIINEI